MSTEDRLFTLLSQARQQRGDAILHSPGELTSLLVAQAPDLFSEIKALADALAAEAGRRIAAAPDPEGEANRIANDIAARERLPLAAVLPAVAVARRLGVGSAMPPAGGAGEWAGDSLVAGAGPPPPLQPVNQPQPGGYPPVGPAGQQGIPQGNYPPPPGGYPPPGGGYPPQGAGPEPIYKNKLVIGAVAAAAAVFAYLQFKPHDHATPPPNQPAGPQAPGGPQGPGAPQGPSAPQGPGYGPAPQQPNNPADPNQPAPYGPGQPNPNQPGGGDQGPQQPVTGQQSVAAPQLVEPGGQLPTLPVTRAQNGIYVITYGVDIANTPAIGMIAMPRNGWDDGPATIGFGPAGQGGEPPSLGGVQLQRGATNQNLPVRLGKVNWDHDNLHVGSICIGFMGTAGQDVNPAGATMCILDSTCQRPIGCGRIAGGGQ